MRCVLFGLIVCLFSGCRNQALPITNPFASPNRVPPPATRPLLPGTAQPYYPGDPVPNSPAGGIHTPTYAPPQVPAGSSTVPPGGWNTYPSSPPISSTPTTNSLFGVQPVSTNIALGPKSEQSIQVPTDSQQLRFAQSKNQLTSNQFATNQFAPNQSATNQFSNPQFPAAANQFPAASFQASGFQGVGQARQRPQQPAAQPQYQPAPIPPSQASQFVNPVQFAQPTPQQSSRAVTLREISSTQVPAQGANISQPARRVGRDGFRPQGSSRALRNRDAEPSRPNFNTTPTPGFGQVTQTNDRFGFDPQYQWLRGQLQYSPTSNQWSLMYASQQGTVDPYGGSLRIANPHVLGNLQPGDYVSIQGRLEMVAFGAQGIAPTYTVTVVQRQQQDIR